MKEYMLRILNQIDHQASWTPGRHNEFVKKCELYIGKLQKDGKLIAAQPLTKSGKIISGSNGSWKEEPLNNSGEVQVGYYHIRANDINDAIEIAKGNPEFEFSTTARIEVRPLKEEEVETGFVYPSKS
jgi:hypothetical protein